MGEQPEIQPEEKPVNPNKAFFWRFIEELHFGKLFRDFLISEKKGLREGWAVILIAASITAYFGYEHGTHSSDDTVKTLNSTISNQASVIQQNASLVQSLTQKVQDKDAEVQKLTTERDKAQVESQIAKNAVAAWMAVAQSCNTNTPLTERLDILTTWVAKNTDSLTNILGVTASSDNTFAITINGQEIKPANKVKGFFVTESFSNPTIVKLSNSGDVFIRVQNSIDTEVDKLNVVFIAPLETTNVNMSGTWGTALPQWSDNIGKWNSWKITADSPQVGFGYFNVTTFNISNISTNLKTNGVPAIIYVDGLGRRQQRFFVIFVF